MLSVLSVIVERHGGRLVYEWLLCLNTERESKRDKDETFDRACCLHYQGVIKEICESGWMYVKDEENKWVTEQSS